MKMLVRLPLSVLTSAGFVPSVCIWYKQTNLICCVQHGLLEASRQRVEMMMERDMNE